MTSKVKYPLSDFVGRNQRPCDEAAFELISEAFSEASEAGPAVDGKSFPQKRTREFSVSEKEPKL